MSTAPRKISVCFYGNATLNIVSETVGSNSLFGEGGRRVIKNCLKYIKSINSQIRKITPKQILVEQVALACEELCEHFWNLQN
jgi:hypothetical protein